MKQLVVSSKITSYSENSFKTYMKEVSKYPIMTPEEEFKVACEARDGNQDALLYLINANLRFVISVAKQYADKKYHIEDLVNEGNFGLIIAAQRFDPTRGFKFISYAVWWIRRSIQEYKNGVAEFIKKPSNRMTALNKYREIKSTLELALEREPTKEEIVEAFDDFINLDVIAELDFQEVCSIDREINDEGFCLKDTIIGSEKTDLASDKSHIKFRMSALLNKLKPRELAIIEMSYGLTGGLPMTLQEIGDTMDLTREAVRQIKKKALFKLKINARRSNISFNDFV